MEEYALKSDGRKGFWITVKIPEENFEDYLKLQCSQSR